MFIASYARSTFGHLHGLGISKTAIVLELSCNDFTLEWIQEDS